MPHVIWMLKVISNWPIFSLPLTGKFVVVCSSSASPQQHSLDPLIMSQLRLLGSLLKMLTDCLHIQTPSGLLGQGISLWWVWRFPCKLVWLCQSAASALGESSITWHQWGTIRCSSHATVQYNWVRRPRHLMFTFISKLLINLPLYRHNTDIYSRKSVWVQGGNKAHTSIFIYFLQESALTL